MEHILDDHKIFQIKARLSLREKLSESTESLNLSQSKQEYQETMLQENQEN